MMTDFIISGIFWVLALYGLIEIIKTIYTFFTYTNIKTERNLFNSCSEESRRKNRGLYPFYFI